MNEIYKAIEHFEHLQKRYTTQHNGKHCELVKTALAALREQAERSKGCDWCQQKHNRYLFTQIADLNAETPIACPWCGKRLEVEP